MAKMSTYTLDESPSTTDSILKFGTDKRIKLTTIANLINLISGEYDTDSFADESITDDQLDCPRVWQEIGRTTTLGSSQSIITVDSLPERQYLRIIIKSSGNSGSGGILYLVFNNDTGLNYANRREVNGVPDTLLINNAYIPIYDAASVTYPSSTVIDIVNNATLEKLVMIYNNTTAIGAANVPNKIKYFSKWANTSDLITRIDVKHSGSNFVSGSEVVVMGHN